MPFTNTTLTIEGTEVTYAHDDRVRVFAHSLNGAAYARCSICESSDYALRFNGAKSHKSWCDLRGEATVRDVPASKASTPATRPASHADARAIHASAKRGEIGAVASDDDVYDLVRSGHVSIDDAMNRDF